MKNSTTLSYHSLTTLWQPTKRNAVQPIGQEPPNCEYASLASEKIKRLTSCWHGLDDSVHWMSIWISRVDRC